MDRRCALSLRGISKRFGSVAALSGVDADFWAGEVHAIVGENGAGKSTLMNIVYGLVQPDAGTVRLDGSPVRFSRLGAARRAGIGMVHQEFTLVDALSVAENLVPALHPAGRLRCDLRGVTTAARRLAAEIGLEVGDLAQPVGALPVGMRQRVEILKALAGNARVLILDEPTSVLTPGEARHLFDVLDRLRARGVAVIFITHKLREVTDIADRVTVLRRGRVVATVLRDEIGSAAITRLMIGTTENVRQPQRCLPEARTGEVLRIEGLFVDRRAGGPGLHKIDLAVGAGEVLGIAGVDGNGQSELFQVLVGIETPAAGRIHIHGRVFERLEPATAIAAGIGHIPPDRQRQGLVLQASVSDNAVLNAGLLCRLGRGPFLPSRDRRAMAAWLVSSHAIRAPDLSAPVATLSGGNQQRLIVARAMAGSPKVLIAFNPTRGLDVAGARLVHDGILGAVGQGTGVLLISTDLDEVVELSDRVAVLYRGQLSEALQRPFPMERLGFMMTGMDVGLER